MNSADLNIKSVIRSNDGEENIEFFTVGQYKRVKDGYVLSYDESDGIGYENCRVSITAGGDKVTIERSGAASSTLCVERDIKHHCVYGTPYGDFTMGINTFLVENGLGDKGGRLYFKYSIDINADFISENEMEITVSLN